MIADENQQGGTSPDLLPDADPSGGDPSKSDPSSAASNSPTAAPGAKAGKATVTVLVVSLLGGGESRKLTVGRTRWGCTSRPRPSEVC